MPEKPGLVRSTSLFVFKILGDQLEEDHSEALGSIAGVWFSIASVNVPSGVVRLV